MASYDLGDLASPAADDKQAAKPAAKYDLGGLATMGSPPEVHDPTEGMTWGEKFLAGAGKGVVDVTRGIGQRLGLVSQAEIDEARKLDAPLMKTGWGRAGNVVGEAGATAPLALIPGAGTLAGATAIGAGLGFAQPTATGESVTRNVLTGAAGGAAGQFGGKALEYGANKIAARQATKAAERQAAEKEALDAFKAARKEGYVAPPKDIPGAGQISKALGGLGGKVKTETAASIRNQRVTNKLAKEELGLAQDKPITEQALQQVRQKAGQAYDAIKKSGVPIKADEQFQNEVVAIGGDANFRKMYKTGRNPEVDAVQEDLFRAQHDPGHAIELLKRLRQDGNDNMKAYARSAKPNDLQIGKAQLDGAKALERLMERNLQNHPKLMSEFQEARKKIAQSYDIERALDSAGNVNAAKLAEKAGKLTGKLKTIGDFASHFETSTKRATKLGGEEGLSAMDFALAIPSGGMTLARPGARGAILSDIGQRMIGTPNYGPGLTLRGAQGAAGAASRVAPYLLGSAGATEQAP